MTAKPRLLLPVLIVLALAWARQSTAQEPPASIMTTLDDWNQDLALFAPLDLNTFGDQPEPREGFFFDYRRLYWNVSRPDTADVKNQGDFTWGTRLSLGWMRPEPESDGWLFEYVHVDGPNQNTTNQPDENVSKLSSIEVEKQWRLCPLHNGSIIEPFIGLRYMKIDHSDAFFIATPVGNAQGSTIENNIFGPQVGLRWYKDYGCWILSTEARYFYGINQQYFQPTNIAQGFNDNKWVPAGDVRLELTYRWTQAVAFTLGGEYLYMANGVGLGDPPFNNQKYQAAGVNFGITVNR